MENFQQIKIVFFGKQLIAVLSNNSCWFQQFSQGNGVVKSDETF